MTRRRDHPFRAIFREDPLGWSSIDRAGYGAGYVGVIHKREMSDRPYRFANEFICGHIAQFLFLPIPPFAITFFATQQGVEIRNEKLFSSLDFNFERDSFPPPDFDACWERLGDLCAGILAFDILVANPDRRRDNLWCDDTTNPTQLLIFDHDYALFGGADGGVGRVETMDNHLGLSFVVGAADHHPFLTRINSARLFDPWYKKMNSLPNWFIDRLSQDARRYGIKTSESKAAAKLLRYRARHLEQIVEANKTEFSGIIDW